MVFIKKKLFLDFDGVISNSIKTIVDLYNQDFQYYTGYRYIHWYDIETWGFNELEMADKKYIDTYFNQARFFDNLSLMENVRYALMKLSVDYDITIVSMGNTPNLRLKCKWIEKNAPFCYFIGCDFADYEDKSHVDMTGGIFIDDSASNLETSNAAEKICFGFLYKWNQGWDGERCLNWDDVLKRLERKDKKWNY